MPSIVTLYPLDKKLVLPKPQEEAPLEKVALLSESGRLVSTRKRDGWGSASATTGLRKHPIALYTRGGNEITENFPAVVDELRSLALPKDTLVTSELFWVSKAGVREDLGALSGLAQASPENARKTQAEAGSARLMLFTPLIIKGKDVSSLPYHQRAEQLGEWLDKRNHELLSRMEHLTEDFAALQKRVVKESWEGLVLYDADAGTAFETNGKHEKPPRPDGCWKWKPLFEADFVATKFEPGTGKNTGLAGKIYIAQIDSRTGQLFPCGEVPLHKKEHKILFANKAIYPIVVEVAYEIRTPKGALRTASVLRERSPLDKRIEECILPEKFWKK